MPICGEEEEGRGRGRREEWCNSVRITHRRHRHPDPNPLSPITYKSQLLRHRAAAAALMPNSRPVVRGALLLLRPRVHWVRGSDCRRRGVSE